MKNYPFSNEVILPKIYNIKKKITWSQSLLRRVNNESSEK